MSHRGTEWTEDFKTSNGSHGDTVGA